MSLACPALLYLCAVQGGGLANFFSPTPQITCVLVSRGRNEKLYPTTTTDLVQYLSVRKFVVRRTQDSVVAVDPKLIAQAAAAYKTLLRFLPDGLGQRVVHFSSLSPNDVQGFKTLYRFSPWAHGLDYEGKNPHLRIVISPSVEIHMKGPTGMPQYTAAPYLFESIPKGGETPDLPMEGPNSILKAPPPPRKPAEYKFLFYELSSSMSFRAQAMAQATALLSAQVRDMNQMWAKRLSDAEMAGIMGTAKMPTNGKLADLPPQLQNFILQSMHNDWQRQGYSSELAADRALQNADLGGIQFSLDFTIIGQSVGSATFRGTFDLDAVGQ